MSSSGPQIDEGRPAKTSGVPERARSSITAVISARISSRVMSGREPASESTIRSMTCVR
jgi:hypothetical protein